jgi:hypothetical protein
MSEKMNCVDQDPPFLWLALQISGDLENSRANCKEIFDRKTLHELKQRKLGPPTTDPGYFIQNFCQFSSCLILPDAAEIHGAWRPRPMPTVRGG